MINNNTSYKKKKTDILESSYKALQEIDSKYSLDQSKINNRNIKSGKGGTKEDLSYEIDKAYNNDLKILEEKNKQQVENLNNQFESSITKSNNRKFSKLKKNISFLTGVI
jgi:hypothetical protein